MSSKFEGPRIRLRTPPVCKKSPPGPDQPAFPPLLLQVALSSSGIDSCSNPVTDSFVAALPRIAVPATYQSTIWHDNRPWLIAFGSSPPFATWDVTVISFPASLCHWGGSRFGNLLRSEQPFDSGPIYLHITSGLGTLIFRATL